MPDFFSLSYLISFLFLKYYLILAPENSALTWSPQQVVHDQASCVLPTSFLLWSRRGQGVYARAVRIPAAIDFIKYLSGQAPRFAGSCCRSYLLLLRVPQQVSDLLEKRWTAAAWSTQPFHLPGLNAGRRNRVLRIRMLLVTKWNSCSVHEHTLVRIFPVLPFCIYQSYFL